MSGHAKPDAGHPPAPKEATPQPAAPAPEAAKPKEKKQKDFHLERYGANATGQFPTVLIKEGREWRNAVLTKEPKISAPGKIEVSFTFPPDVQVHTKEIDYAPEVVAFKPQDKIGGYDIEQQHTRPDGRIEFDVKHPTTNEQVKGISQELLLRWKEVERLELEAHALEQRLSQVANEHAQKIVSDRTELEKTLASIRAELPSAERMATLGVRGIDTKVKRLTELFHHAEEKIHTIKAILDVAPTLGQHTPKKYEGVQLTEAEIQERKEAVQRFKRSIDEQIAQRKKQIDQAERDYLDDHLNYEKTLYDTRMDLWENWDEMSRVATAGTQAERDDLKKRREDVGLIPPVGRRPRRPAEPNYARIQIPITDKRAYDKDRAEVIEKVYHQALLTLENHPDPVLRELWRDMKTNRREQAYYDIQDTVDVPVSGGTVKDYKGDLKDSDSTITKASIIALKEVVSQWENTKKDTKDAEKKFDFDVETDRQLKEIERLLDLVPKKSNHQPEDRYAQTFKDLKDLESKITDDKKQLSNIKSYTATFPLMNLTWKDMQDERLRFVQMYDGAIKGEEKTLNSLLNQAALDKEKKGIAAHRDEQKARVQREQLNAEKQEREMVDLPLEVVEKLLRPKREKVKELMTELYKHITVHEVKQAVDGTAQAPEKLPPLPLALLKDFQNLLENDDENVLDQGLMKLLRDRGVKDWKGFVKIWRERLAENFANTMQVAASETLRKKVAEEADGFKAKFAKVWSMKGQIISRIGLTMATVGGATALGAFIVGTGGAGAVAAGIAGGTVGGLVRKFMNDNVFGKLLKFDKGNDAKAQKIIDDIKGKMVTSVLEGSYSEQNWETSIEGLKQVASILRSSVRELTREAASLPDVEDKSELAEQLRTLSADQREIYDHALQDLAEQNPEEEQKLELARAIAKLVDKGNKLNTEVFKELNKTSPGVLEQIVSGAKKVMGAAGGRTGSGIQGYVAASLAGGLLATMYQLRDEIVFSVDALGEFGRVGGLDVAAGIMGGLSGAIMGYEYADSKYAVAERKKAKEELVARMERIYGYRRDHAMYAGEELERQKEPIRNDIIFLKRLLHGSVDQHELGGVVSEVKQLADGRKVPVADRALIIQIQDLVRAMETEDRIFEKEGQSELEMRDAIDMMKERGIALAKEQKGKGKKNMLGRIGYTLAGAAGGAIAGMLIGKTVRTGVESAKSKFGYVSPEEKAFRAGIKEDDLKSMESPISGRRVGAVPYESKPFAEQHAADSGSLPDGQHGLEAADVSHSVAGTYTIQKGDGLLNAANHFQNDPVLGPKLIEHLRETHPEWRHFSDKGLLHQWRVEEVERFRVRIPKGGGPWENTKTLQPGAKVEEVFTKDGAHLEVADESKAAGLVHEHGARTYGGVSAHSETTDMSPAERAKLMDDFLSDAGEKGPHVPMTDKELAALVDPSHTGTAAVVGRAGIHEAALPHAGEKTVNLEINGKQAVWNIPEKGIGDGAVIWRQVSGAGPGMPENTGKPVYEYMLWDASRMDPATKQLGVWVETNPKEVYAQATKSAHVESVGKPTAVEALPEGAKKFATAKDYTLYQRADENGRNYIYIQEKNGRVLKVSQEEFMQRGSGIPAVDATKSSGTSIEAVPQQKTDAPATVETFKAPTLEQMIDSVKGTTARIKLQSVSNILDVRQRFLDNFDAFMERNRLRGEYELSQDQLNRVRDDLLTNTDAMRSEMQRLLMRGVDPSRIPGAVLAMDKLGDVREEMNLTGNLGFKPQVQGVEQHFEETMIDHLKQTLSDAEDEAVDAGFQAAAGGR